MTMLTSLVTEFADVDLQGLLPQNFTGKVCNPLEIMLGRQRNDSDLSLTASLVPAPIKY